MAKVAFLGLGVMGYPMAGHLKNRAGHEVTVYNRTAAKAEKWVAQHGGKAAATPRAAINRLHGEMARIIALPDVSKAIASLDLIPTPPATVEANQQYLAAEARKWGDLVRKLGLAGSQ